ncbi:MAG TPA: NAD(P)-dependent oxidoreductase [Spirochaetales bacterium]|nr:NAD(P)-dependent oxidoreductase [Spirochaetales bacterium]HPG85635.1 NAD(P)-dependent oxidoreductase [Spirochaetales bacterium]
MTAGAGEGRLLAVVTDDRFGGVAEETAVLGPLGVELRVASCSSSAEVAAACADADAVLANLAPVDAAAVAAMRRCRVVSRYGVGLDNVDLAACAARGIAVANVPGYCDAEVAEHALALLLSLTRGVPGRDAAVRGGAWNLATGQASVAGSVVGVAGFGGSGLAFARAVLGLRPSRLAVWSPNLSRERLDAALGPAAAALGVELRAASFDELLSGSDFLSLHLRLTAETAGLWGEAAFSRMKRGAYLVNTARGGLVEASALARALASGRLAGAGVDVYDVEPPPPGHPLLSAPNCVLTDHCAYRSTRSIAELKRRCAENAARALGLRT